MDYVSRNTSVGLQSMETALFNGIFSNGNSNFSFFVKTNDQEKSTVNKS